jgi:hypothetical protein
MLTSISSGTLGVHNTLWDTFTIEMCQQINQVEILKEKWPIVANLLELFRMSYRASVGGCVNWSFIVLEGRRGLIVGNHDCGSGASGSGSGTC